MLKLTNIAKLNVDCFVGDMESFVTVVEFISKTVASFCNSLRCVYLCVFCGWPRFCAYLYVFYAFVFHTAYMLCYCQQSGVDLMGL